MQIPLPTLTTFLSFLLSLPPSLTASLPPPLPPPPPPPPPPPRLSLLYFTLFLHPSLTPHLPCPVFLTTLHLTPFLPPSLPSSLPKALHGHFSNTVDNICWLAPEVLAQDLSGYSYQSDIYSIGIAALELVTGEAPFAGLPITEVQLINFMSRYKPGCVHYASVILSIIGTVSLVPKPCPACHCLQYFRARGEPGNEAKEQLIIMNYCRLGLLSACA